jgi:hypothetical protein
LLFYAPGVLGFWVFGFGVLGSHRAQSPGDVPPVDAVRPLRLLAGLELLGLLFFGVHEAEVAPQVVGSVHGAVKIAKDVQVPI